MGSLKTYCSKEIRKFIQEKRRLVELQDVMGFFGLMYKQAASYNNSENSFKCTDIHPRNCFAFPEDEFYKEE